MVCPGSNAAAPADPPRVRRVAAVPRPTPSCAPKPEVYEGFHPSATSGRLSARSSRRRRGR